MKLSTKGRYAARLMLELALKYNNGPVLLKDIAQHQEISVGYLEHIIPRLKAAGLVNSSRGSHGGYALLKPPSSITSGEVVRAVEGNLSIVECVSAPKVCNKVSSCVTREIWEDISYKVNAALDSITLQDMVDRYKDKHEKKELMYYI